MAIRHLPGVGGESRALVRRVQDTRSGLRRAAAIASLMLV
jgi:hypothetical protein